ncbi:transposase [Rhodococcus sp. IEGM 1351]|uniref:transposase n=1 Tax=Rhodococcus sp. IEGM 1351 TaxID=3047089 RepID=UPI0032D58F93
MTSAHDIDLFQFLTDRLTDASPDLLRSLLSTFIDALMGAEADSLCGAGFGERSEDRVNSRNGYRHRDFDTRAGTLDVASRSCVRARTSRIGCCSAASVPSGP